MSSGMSRREFLLMAAAGGVSARFAGLGSLRPVTAASRPTLPSGGFAYSPRVRKFVVGLPGLGPAEAEKIGQYIPLATKSTRRFAGRMTDVYDMAVAEYSQTMHPDLPGPTRFWGYRDTAAAEGMCLGGVIVAHRDRPVLLSVTNNGLLPELIGTPLVIQDKSFVAEDILGQDLSWRWGEPGSLWYPHVYVPNAYEPDHPDPRGRWDWGPTLDPDPSHGTMPLPALSAVPEAFLDTPLVNGGLYPVAKVAAQRVRFRILNGAQARFLHLTLVAEDTADPGEAKRGAPGPTMYQVGTEGGFLPAVAVHDNRTTMRFSAPETVDPRGPFNLLLAPAERADAVIDFSGVAPGTSFILCNDAPAPFPDGDSRNGFFTGDESQMAEGGSPSTRAGRGPNTHTLLKITVTHGTGEKVSTDAWLRRLNGHLKANYLSGNQPPLIIHGGEPSAPRFPYAGPVTRRLTLNEDFDEYGRLIQHIGTFTSKSANNQGMPTWGLPYEAPATETPAAGATEIWQIFNPTGDVHPMHFHLVNVQLLQRQSFTGDPSH